MTRRFPALGTQHGVLTGSQSHQSGLRRRVDVEIRGKSIEGTYGSRWQMIITQLHGYWRTNILGMVLQLEELGELIT